ncbi:MAG: Hpt domain-containing protein [Deltaproteobacteria bacterium]|nr:Hpt domain-containing protein [Deltaproteobacteria bacterium]
MDVKQVASQLGLEEDDIYDVLELFIQTAPSDLTKMATGLNKQDTVQIGEAAHSLKGSTGALGLMDISNHAQLIMKQSREKNIEDLIRTVPRFLNQMKDLLVELEQVLKNR